MRQYATSADYTTVTGEAPPVNVDVLLRTASAFVDHLLRGVVYDVDPVTLLPTDTGVAETLRDATCLIAQEANASGALAVGAASAGGWASVSIGNVSLSKGTSSGGAASDGTVYVAGVAVPVAAVVALQSIGTVSVIVC